MLADKDRIFTNIYGLQDRSVAGAKSRGLWDGTKKILELGPEAICDVVKKSGLCSIATKKRPHGFRRSREAPLPRRSPTPANVLAEP